MTFFVAALGCLTGPPEFPLAGMPILQRLRGGSAGVSLTPLCETSVALGTGDLNQASFLLLLACCYQENSRRAGTHLFYCLSNTNTDVNSLPSALVPLVVEVIVFPPFATTIRLVP